MDAGEGVTDESIVIREEEIVTFEDEGNVAVGTVTAEIQMPRALASAAQDTKTRSLESFLERGYLIKNFLWDATATPGTDLFTIAFPDDLFAQSGIREKISGFTWFRGTLVLDINVNAQKFQQGRLIMWFIPYSNLRVLPTPARHLTSKTGYPHADFDLADSQSMTLRIPFVAPITHLNLVRNQWSIGTMTATVYGQLAGGDTNIGGSVWGHFEDVDLTVPTGLPLYPVVVPACPLSTIKTQAQVNLKGEASASGGTVSSMARAVGSVSKIAAGIPGLAHIAAPVSAVAGIVGNIASAFGFSKPVSEKLVEPVQVSTARHANNYNGVDMSKKLAFDTTNGLSMDPLFGSKVDEMSLSYIARTPNYYNSFRFRKVDTAGTVLYKTRVSPIGEYQYYYDSAHPIYAFTHLAYVARAFKYWSGGIKYKFRFVKTKFHSGRLRIIIVPQAVNGTNETLATFDVNKCISYVVDLKEKSEFEFLVPFTFHAPMMPTGHNGTNSTVGKAPGHSYVVVQVLNELRTPSALVSDKIDVIVEKAGGEDIAFHVPMQVEGAVVTADGFAPIPPKKTVAQVSTREDVQLGQDSPRSFLDAVPLTSPSPALSCVGETVTSVRQLLKRFQQVALATDKATLLQPYAGVGWIHPGNTGDTTNTMDYYSYFMPLYAFMRGGMRMKFFYQGIDSSTQWFDQVLLADPVEQAGPSSLFPIVQAAANAGNLVFNPNIPNVPVRDGCLEVDVPYYNMTSMSPCVFNQVLYETNGTLYLNRFNRFIHWCTGNDNTPARAVYRAVSEDFQAGFLVGTPPIVWRPT